MQSKRFVVVKFSSVDFIGRIIELTETRPFVVAFGPIQCRFERNKQVEQRVGYDHIVVDAKEETGDVH